jgi:hypothetical protein
VIASVMLASAQSEHVVAEHEMRVLWAKHDAAA